MHGQVIYINPERIKKLLAVFIYEYEMSEYDCRNKTLFSDRFYNPSVIDRQIHFILNKKF